MATRRRIGVSIATSEAARRQLMQPVVCWEKAWVTPSAAPNSSTKILKWVRTQNQQQFSEGDEGMDEPLAPLPDEPEVVEGDDEIIDQEEAVQSMAASVAPETASAVDATEPNSVAADVTEPPTKPPTPQPPALSLPIQEIEDPSEEPQLETAQNEVADMLDTALAPMDGDMSVDEKMGVELEVEDELDMAALGPDGTAFEGAQDLVQLEAGDTLMGGPLMDSTLDPFAGSIEEPTHEESVGGINSSSL